MTAAPPSNAAILKPDTQTLYDFWQAMVRPGDVHEVRIPGTRKGPQRLFGTASGYFDNADDVLAALGAITGADAAGVYMTMNPVKPALLARACNRLVDKVKTTASDDDIVCRRHLLIDTDPMRDPADVSATDEEEAGAIARRDAIRQYLAEELGWPEPAVVSESGNGGALLYRVDLPNDAAATDLVQRALMALDMLFSDERVKLDVVNYNAARITKVAGSIAAKGEHFVGHAPLLDRPWRLATATFPAQAAVVTAEQVAAVAAGALASEPARNAGYQCKAGGVPGQRIWSMDELLRLNGLNAAGRTWCGGIKYVLDRCLTSPDHTDGAAFLEMPSGAIVYRCHHNRCAGKGWRYVREHGLIVVPGAASSNGRAGASGQEAGSSDAKTTGNGVAGPGNDESATGQQEPGSVVRRMPELHEAALSGLAGDIVRAISPHTEAHDAALLVSLLVYFGNIINSAPHALVTSKRHGTNLFVVLVGRTSGSRKGTSRAEIEALFNEIDAAWGQARVQTGLSSGEGLISAVRDPVSKAQKDGETVMVVDEGVVDKRLVVVEEEFCGPVKIMGRDGNTLSAIVRQAWDGHNLGTLTRHSPMRATKPHVCILGHTTQPELLKYLTETEMADGFANRFLWVCVERSKRLPHGGGRVDYGDTIERLRKAVEFARGCAVRPIARDAEANALWERVYPQLTAERPGMFGAVTSRAEAQALRLSVLYALLDGSAEVRVHHLRAALALWKYCQDSARYIFGDKVGDRLADRILAALRQAGKDGLTLTQMNSELGNNVKSERLHVALDLLQDMGLIRQMPLEGKGGGRVYHAT